MLSFRFLRWFASLALLAGASSALAGPKGEITVRQLGDTKITIDGDIKDWPLDKFKAASQQPLFPEGQSAQTTSAKGDHLVFDRKRIGLFNGTTDEAFQANDSDFGVTTYFAYDLKYLYVLAVYIDDTIRGDRDTSQFGTGGFFNDGFEFFLDTKGDSTDCIADDAFPTVDQVEPNIDDFQVTVAVNANFKPAGSAANILGARQSVERGGNPLLFQAEGGEKGGPGGIYRDQLDAMGGPDIAARSFDDLRAAGAKNAELAAKPNVKFTGYAIEMRIPLRGRIPNLTTDHAVGFEIFWRDVDKIADDPEGKDVGAGGGDISWASWGQSTAVDCADPVTSLFNSANWGQLVFDKTDPLVPIPAGKPTVLFVTSNADNAANADGDLVEFIQDNGYGVVPFTAGGSTPEGLRDAAKGKSVVFISETIGSTSVVDPAGQGTGIFSLKDTDVPVISAEAYMYDNADWVKRTEDGSNDFTQWGNSSRAEVAETPIADGRDSLFVRKADHPIVKGVSGKVKVYNELYSLNYGLPSADADIVASIQEDGSFPTIFVYEKGDKLTDGSVAPNRRIGFYLGQNAAPDFNTALDIKNISSAGKTLLLNTLAYAAGSAGGGTVTPPSGTITVGGVDTVKLTHVVPDAILFNTSTPNLDNWEPHASVLGNATFLVEANTFAEGSTDNQRFVLAFQPAAGGAAKLGEAFFSDDGKPFTGQINASRQNGNPGRVAGDKRPGAVNLITGAEASPHTVPAFGSDNRWQLGFSRTREDGVESRYGTVQTFKYDGGTQTPLSKAIDVAHGRVTSGVTPSDQTTRFGGDIMALDNGNFVAAVEDRSRIHNPDGNAAVVTILAPNGAIVKETFSVANGDLWANLAAYKGGFAVRVAGIIYFFDNAGNAKGQVDPADSTIGFDRGRGDGTRLAGHINSPFVYLAGTVGEAKDDGTPIKNCYVAAFDSRDQKFAAAMKVHDFEGDSDRVNLAVDALDRVVVAFEAKPADYELPQTVARVLAFDAAGKKFNPLTTSFFPFKNHAKSGITVFRPTVAVTTKQILIAGKGTVNLQGNPGAGADSAERTTIYTVIAHPAPAEDPTAPAVVDAPADTATGLLGYWRMDETSGTAVPDSSGKGNNGTIVNSPTGTWVTDAERGAVYKATGTSVINFGVIVPAMTTANDFTWSLWLKSDETGTASTPNNNIVFGNRYNTTGADFSPREFIKFTPSNFEWHFGGAGQNVNYTDFVVGAWTHHAVVKQGSKLTYYRDGVESTVGTITGGPVNPQPLYLGGQGTQERWRGAADEVAIYDRALTPTDVKLAFDLGKAGQPLAGPSGGNKPTIASVRADGANLTLTWAGGTGPFKVQRRDDIATGAWVDVGTTNDRTASVPRTGNAGFFRVVGQ